jgi:hypothetical protein
MTTSFTYSTGSKTRSRHLRRDVRVALGSSSEQLPDVLSVLTAARALGALLDNASGGAFGLAVWDFEKGESIPVGSAVEKVVNVRQAERERVERIRAQFAPETDPAFQALAHQAGRLDGGR